MTEIQADVAIIGSGPAGTAAAIHLGQLGIRNVVLVDRHDFPREKTCGSAVSPKGLGILKALGVWEEISSEAYRIKGLRLVTPGDREVYLSGAASEQTAWAGYEARCRRAFLASFWSAKLWRRTVASPVLDWVIGAGRRPIVKTAVGKLMARM
jgi:2-polyprenyl-6-methoxyphenol hydroxylase-like FAD-dependent oxidoreductase